MHNGASASAGALLPVIWRVMRHLTIPEAKDVICGELSVPGDWVVANIATNMFWPVKAQKVAFCGVDVWVMPLMKDRSRPRHQPSAEAVA